jgi:hypothetical protein
MSCKVGVHFLCLSLYFRTLFGEVTNVEMREVKCHVDCQGQKDRIRGVDVGWNRCFEGETSDGLGDVRCRSADKKGFLEHERVSLEKNEIKKIKL